jgi:hypothetical protein
MAFKKYGNIVRALAAAFAVSAALPVLAQTADPSARYEAMIAQVKKGDYNLDFRELRYAYAESPRYRPYLSPTDALAGTMFRAYKAQDFDGAIEAAKKILAINYLDIDAQIVCDLSYRMTSNMVSGETCHEMASHLLRSIFDSGDGQTPETAYQVIAVREEYSVVNAMGLTLVSQHLVTRDDHRFDAVDVTDKTTGEPRTIYFNVDRPMRWLDRQNVGKK